MAGYSLFTGGCRDNFFAHTTGTVTVSAEHVSNQHQQRREPSIFESKQGKNMRLMRWSFAVLLLAGLTGCQSSLMVKSSASTAEPVPASGKALVVFMRPSFFGGAIQSSVYDTHDSGDTFIGIVSTKDKIGYQADPGDHLFMVVAENADFMIAHLDAGKTYYVLVSPRMGMWKARFSLLPIHNDASAKYSTQSADFSQWMSKTSWVSVTPQAKQWYADHAADIHAKKMDYMQKWDKASAQQKEELTLKADDGK